MPDYKVGNVVFDNYAEACAQVQAQWKEEMETIITQATRLAKAASLLVADGFKPVPSDLRRTPVAVLEALANDDIYVVRCVAANTSTPLYVLKQMMQRGNNEILVRRAKNNPSYKA